MLLQLYTINNILITILIIICLISFVIFKKHYSELSKYQICNLICILFLIPIKVIGRLTPFKNYVFVNHNYPVTKLLLETEYIPISPAITNNVSDNHSNSSFFNSRLLNTIWITVALCYFLIQIARYLHFRYKVLHFSKDIKDKEILSILKNLKKEQKIWRNIRIKYSYFVTSPLLISCIHPTILLPNNTSKEHIYYIIKHELLHLKYFDLWFQRIRLITQSLFWFNPLVWILCNKADTYMERACDYHVLKNCCEESKKKYANAIFYVISSGSQKNQILTSNFYQSKTDVYYRIEEIMKMKNEKRKKKFFLFTTIATLLSIIVASSVYSSPKQLTDLTPHLNSILIPLNETFAELGFQSYSKDGEVLVFKKGNKEINFVNEANYNLKKNKNTYYTTILNDNFFIKIGVLKSLGYNVEEKNGLLIITNSPEEIELDTTSFSNNLIKNSSLVNELDLPRSNMFYSQAIIIENVDFSELNNYTIETHNLMNYDFEQLKGYIEANYNMTVKEYKNSLISLEQKYPSYLRVTYDLLNNGQALATISASDGFTYIEPIMEIRDRNVFFDK